MNTILKLRGSRFAICGIYIYRHDIEHTPKSSTMLIPQIWILILNPRVGYRSEFGFESVIIPSEEAMEKVRRREKHARYNWSFGG